MNKNLKSKGSLTRTLVICLQLVLLFSVTFSGAKGKSGKSIPNVFPPEPMISYYRDTELKSQVSQWKTLLVADERKVVSIDPRVLERKVNDPFIQNTLESIASVFNSDFSVQLEFLVFRFEKPFMEITNNKTVIISTGLLMQVESDDQLLGLLAHEVGHRMFYEKSLILKKAIEVGDQVEVARANLALIEFSCDAFAARYLMWLGRNPLSFLDLLKKFNCESQDGGYHPNTSKRLEFGKLITQKSFDGKDQTQKIKAIKTSIASN